jgi:hypothetical protein
MIGVARWLTCGVFGLEASLRGLFCVIITIIYLYKLKQKPVLFQWIMLFHFRNKALQLDFF